MVRQKVDCRPSRWRQGGAVGSTAAGRARERQLQSGQPLALTTGQPLQGPGRQAMIEVGVGGSPLQQQPLNPPRTTVRAEAIQHRQGGGWGSAAE
jgi:hypothetical protein